MADRRGRRTTLVVSLAMVFAFGFLMAPMFVAGRTLEVALYLSLGMALIGMTYGPLGTFLSELFPTEVRYTGTSLSFNLAGIFGASLAPYFATTLATRYGLTAVGYYLSVAAAISLAAQLLTPGAGRGEFEA